MLSFDPNKSIPFGDDCNINWTTNCFSLSCDTSTKLGQVYEGLRHRGKFIFWQRPYVVKHGIARQLLCTVALATTAGFFIRWLNDRTQRHIHEELMTRKYELDFERASFVVEWAMEWAKNSQEVPQFLIERLSRGLFESNETEKTAATAADAVANAIFGNASAAKLKVNGQELTFDRNGIKRMKSDELATDN